MVRVTVGCLLTLRWRWYHCNPIDGMYMGISLLLQMFKRLIFIRADFTSLYLTLPSQPNP